MSVSESGLRTQELRLGYGDRLVVGADGGVDLAVPDGAVTVVVGANASGKSTLLRGLARLLTPAGGTVLLDGRALHTTPTREVARRIGLLPQASTAPEGITVADLVARGRTPHQRWYSQWSEQDEQAVGTAMAATGVADLAARRVDELSGGQRQRVWLATVLAQETPILLLDEPTTYLDLAHQVDLLELVVRLNGEHGRTVVMVLHDLNQAARYAHHVVAMKDGRVVAAGAPQDVVTAGLVRDVFGLDCVVVACPVSGRPLVVPCGTALPEPPEPPRPVPHLVPEPLP